MATVIQRDYSGEIRQFPSQGLQHQLEGVDITPGIMPGSFSYISSNMPIARSRMNIFALDEQASKQDAPYLIQTSDCSNPHEIDDGVQVECLPSAQEAYRVRVCVADTSRLYSNSDIRLAAMRKVHARYWELGDGEQAYEPMIDPAVIKDLELSEGNVRRALIISFIVGRDVLPSQLSIDFGRVETIKNHNYKQFSRKSRGGGELQRYSRASAYILETLRFTAGGDSTKPSDINDSPHNDIDYGTWKHGARMNESFMVAANHLVGRQLKEEGKPAIYRVHDLKNDHYHEIIEANVARYTQTPGPHDGLGLDPYCRVTSPLRRLEDFVMNYHLNLRSKGKDATPQELRDMADAIRLLNKQMIFDAVTSSRRRYRNNLMQAGSEFLSEEATA